MNNYCGCAAAPVELGPGPTVRVPYFEDELPAMRNEFGDGANATFPPFHNRHAMDLDGLFTVPRSPAC